MQGQWLLVTRSLPTDSPVPYFQPIERGHMSEGGLSDIDSQRAVFSRGIQMSLHTTNVPSGDVKYHPVTTESDGLSTYMGLDDYDTLFGARHGRGALRWDPFLMMGPCTPIKGNVFL